MKTQLLSRAGKRLLSPVVLYCLWTFAVPADARGQQFSNPVCTVQSFTQGDVTVWRIKGTATVTGLIANPNTTSVTVTVVFQRQPNGQFGYNDLFSATQTTSANNGTASIDTGFMDLGNNGPNPGDQYRIALTGTWMNPGPPPQNGKIPLKFSPAVTPVPINKCMLLDMPRPRRYHAYRRSSERRLLAGF